MRTDDFTKATHWIATKDDCGITAGTKYAIWIDPWDNEYVITDNDGHSSSIWIFADGYFVIEEETK